MRAILGEKQEETLGVQTSTIRSIFLFIIKGYQYQSRTRRGERYGEFVERGERIGQARLAAELLNSDI